MVVNRKPTGRASSVPVGLAWSLAAALMTLFAGIALVALLIHREKMPCDAMGYGIMTVLILSAWMGAAVAWRKIKRRRALMCLASGGGFFLALLAVTALFFGGQYRAVGETGLLILCGSLLPVMGGVFPKSKARQGKFRIRNG